MDDTEEAQFAMSKEDEEANRKQLSELFNRMMDMLYKLKSSMLPAEIMAKPVVQDFIKEHAKALDSSFKQVPMSDKMLSRLKESTYIFSGLKTFHELHEAFPSLLDENGKRKPFEQFLSDVRKVDNTYNGSYLKAEYNFCKSSALMAARWDSFSKNSERYDLQYRTAHDNRVRPEHAALDGITLPMDDPFWETAYPPNSWNCRCTVVQVRKGKYPTTPTKEAQRLAEEAMAKDKKGIFKFNSGITGKAIPDYNPYSLRRCNDCAYAKGTGNLVKMIPDNELCAACLIVRALRKSDAKETKKKAKHLQGTSLRNPGFKHEVKISKASIIEWTNQPNKYPIEKNKMLLNIREVFAKAKYLGTADNHKNKPRVVQSHIFETEIKPDIKALIIVREYDWGEYVLHSISEGGELYKHIKKK